jgi:adenosylhomocysteine nucleosidase
VGIPSELNHLRARLEDPSEETTPVGTLWEGIWAHQHVILAQCAIGKVNATMMLQWLVDHKAPDILLNCGSSGAIDPRLRVGDVVIADSIVPYDAGVFLERRFVTTGNGLPNQKPMHWRVFPAQEALVGLASRAATAAGLRSLRSPSSSAVQAHVPAQPPLSGGAPRVWVGPIASGDQVVFANRPKQWLHETFRALAVENEGAAVAQVALVHGLPWLVLRGISDTADARAAFDFTPFLRYSDDGSGILAWIRVQIRRLAAIFRDRHTLGNWRRFNRGVHSINTNISLLLEHLIPCL